MDILEDGRIVLCTWDDFGSVYIVENPRAPSDQIKIKKIATGLHEPLGLKVVEGTIYVLQKQELTKLVDTDGDEIIDSYLNVSNKWTATTNYHEFAFGLEYKDGFFYGTLSTAMDSGLGGMALDSQTKDRGRVMKISESDGEIEFIASGLKQKLQ